MKTTLIAIALSTLAFAATAQDMGVATGQNTDLEFKPGAGAKNLEFQFAPLGGSPLGISGIRFRHFSSPLSAVRANVFLGVSSTSKVTQDEDSDIEAKELNDYKTTFDIGIRPGIERHFAGTRRLSPYIGAELDLFYRYTRETSEVQVGSDVKESFKTGDGGFFRVGANAVAGFDFYVAQHLYLGAELGFGIAYKRASTIVTENSAGDKIETRTDAENAINLAPNVVTAIRLGYIF